MLHLFRASLMPFFPLSTRTTSCVDLRGADGFRSDMSPGSVWTDYSANQQGGLRMFGAEAFKQEGWVDHGVQSSDRGEARTDSTESARRRRGSGKQSTHSVAATRTTAENVRSAQQRSDSFDSMMSFRHGEHISPNFSSSLAIVRDRPATAGPTFGRGDTVQLDHFKELLAVSPYEETMSPPPGGRGDLLSMISRGSDRGASGEAGGRVSASSSDRRSLQELSGRITAPPDVSSAIPGDHTVWDTSDLRSVRATGPTAAAQILSDYYDSAVDAADHSVGNADSAIRIGRVQGKAISRKAGGDGTAGPTYDIGSVVCGSVAFSRLSGAVEEQSVACGGYGGAGQSDGTPGGHRGSYSLYDVEGRRITAGKSKHLGMTAQDSTAAWVVSVADVVRKFGGKESVVHLPGTNISISMGSGSETKGNEVMSDAQSRGALADQEPSTTFVSDGSSGPQTQSGAATNSRPSPSGFKRSSDNAVMHCRVGSPASPFSILSFVPSSPDGEGDGVWPDDGLMMFGAAGKQTGKRTSLVDTAGNTATRDVSGNAAGDIMSKETETFRDCYNYLRRRREASFQQNGGALHSCASGPQGGVAVADSTLLETQSKGKGREKQRKGSNVGKKGLSKDAGLGEVDQQVRVGKFGPFEPITSCDDETATSAPSDGYEGASLTDCPDAGTRDGALVSCLGHDTSPLPLRSISPTSKQRGNRTSPNRSAGSAVIGTVLMRSDGCCVTDTKPHCDHLNSPLIDPKISTHKVHARKDVLDCVLGDMHAPGVKRRQQSGRRRAAVQRS